MHGDRDGAGAQLVCERLRKLIPDCVSKHMNKSAIFYAGKLCCMSNNNHHDVYLLAQVRHVLIGFKGCKRRTGIFEAQADHGNELFTVTHRLTSFTLCRHTM